MFTLECASHTCALTLGSHASQVLYRSTTSTPKAVAWLPHSKSVVRFTIPTNRDDLLRFSWLCCPLRKSAGIIFPHVGIIHHANQTAGFIALFLGFGKPSQLALDTSNGHGWLAISGRTTSRRLQEIASLHSQ